MSLQLDLCKFRFNLEIRGAVPLSFLSKSLTLNCLEAPAYLSSALYAKPVSWCGCASSIQSAMS